jgi:hypothetical protein
MMRESPKFATESDLCTAFIAAIKAPWVAYAETEGWDILLANSDDGRQIGIEAKLKLNAKVLSQAVEGHGLHGDVGPDYRAVLVPADQNNHLTALAPFCGITIIGMSTPSRWSTTHFYPGLPTKSFDWPETDWHERLPTKRHRIPEFVPDCVAGSPAPIQLTTWKISALKLSVLLDETGYLTREDFRRVGIDIRRWIGVERWLQASPIGFVRGSHYPNFKTQHPIVLEQIRADPTKWQRPQQGLA